MTGRRPPPRRRRGRRARFLATCAAIGVLLLPAAAPVGARTLSGDGALPAVLSASLTAEGSDLAAARALSATSEGAAFPAPSRSEAYAAEVPYPQLLPRTTQDADVTLRLDSLSPSIVTPESAVHVQVSVTNRAQDPADLRLRLRLGREPLISRADLDAAPAGEAPRVGAEATQPRLAPGATARVALEIPASQVPMSRAFGVLPLTVEAQRDTRTSTLATYLPYERVKEYEPLRVSVAVPLTVDPEPAVESTEAQAREAAWGAILGSGSRLDRILEGVQDSPVTFAVDPVLVGVGPAPSTPAPAPHTSSPTTGSSARLSETPIAESAVTPPATPSPATPSLAAPAPTPAPAASPAAPGPARSAFAARLAAATKGRPVWALPADDPDLVGLTESSPSPQLFADAVAADPALRDLLEPSSLTPVAWPARMPTRAARERLLVAYGQHQPSAWILPRSAVQTPGVAGSSPHRYADGTPVLAYDDTLSRLLANTAAPEQGAGITQRFLAETMTLLQEAPGSARQVLVAAPRWVNPDPQTLTTVMAATRSTPWAPFTSTAELLTDTAFENATAVDAQPSPAAGAGSTTAPTDDQPGSVGLYAERADTPLDASQVERIQRDLERVAGMSAILPGQAPLVADVGRADRALLSTRWRGGTTGWEELRGLVDQRVAAAVGGVAVVPSQVNFFAEAGIVQVTVVNNLNVEVHDVHLRLVPEGRVSRLRILEEQPMVLTIRPRSRATVRVAVEAIAPGVAPVRAELTTPTGDRLGPERTVLDIRVQPMNGWVVLAIGGVLGAVFLVGLFRTIRRNRPRVSAEELKEIDLA